MTNHQLQQPRSPLIFPAPLPPIHPIHGETLGDASRNIRGLRLGQPGGIPMPRGHGDGTHQLGCRTRLRPPYSAGVASKGRTSGVATPKIHDELPLLTDGGDRPHLRCVVRLRLWPRTAPVSTSRTSNGGDHFDMKSPRRASTAPVSRPAPIGRLQTLCDPFWQCPLTRRGGGGYFDVHVLTLPAVTLQQHGWVASLLMLRVGVECTYDG